MRKAVDPLPYVLVCFASAHLQSTHLPPRGVFIEPSPALPPSRPSHTGALSPTLHHQPRVESGSLSAAELPEVLFATQAANGAALLVPQVELVPA